MGKENIVCGKVVIREIIQKEIGIDTLYISKRVKTEHIEDIISYAKRNSADIKIVYENDLNNICESKVHQGIAAKIQGYKFYKFSECLEELKKEQLPFVLILDGIQDPGNLGGILRSAECMGVKNVIIPQKRSVNLTDAVWKTSMGAVAHLNICRTNNIPYVITKLKEEGFKIVGSDLKAENYIDELNYNYPLALIVGNEHEGIDPKLIDMCDIKLKIPMKGSIQSLNASVATGIILHTIKSYQRR